MSLNLEEFHPVCKHQGNRCLVLFSSREEDAMRVKTVCPDRVGGAGADGLRRAGRASRHAEHQAPAGTASARAASAPVILHEGWTENPDTLNPAYAFLTQAYTIFDLIYGTLTTEVAGWQIRRRAGQGLVGGFGQRHLDHPFEGWDQVAQRRAIQGQRHRLGHQRRHEGPGRLVDLVELRQRLQGSHGAGRRARFRS